MKDKASGRAAIREDPSCHLASVWNRRGESVTPSAIAATSVKNRFGRVLDRVIQGGIVVITKHDMPKAVLMSVDEFNALASATHTKLDALTNDFDAILGRMQTARARAGMKAAFGASPKKLGRAAVAVARKRA